MMMMMTTTIKTGDIYSEDKLSAGFRTFFFHIVTVKHGGLTLHVPVETSGLFVALT